MAEITASLVKELREKTGAGMMDCKKALNETGADLEQAIDWLRKKGLSAAAKKAGRVAAEGLVGVSTNRTIGAVVEVNAETDFVARNEKFQNFVSDLSTACVINPHTVETLTQSSLPGHSTTVADSLTQLIAVIGENMSLRRVARLEVNQGIVCSYVHNSIGTGLGKIGVLVALESQGSEEALSAIGKKIAMHIAAAHPLALTTADVDPTALDRERNIFKEQAESTGRPQEIVAKMVEGRIRKYYEEVVLLEQSFVLDPQIKVRDFLEQEAKKIGHAISLTGFVRYALGEGIEKEQTDFAAEVQAQASASV